MSINPSEHYVIQHRLDLPVADSLNIISFADSQRLKRTVLCCTCSGNERIRWNNVWRLWWTQENLLHQLSQGGLSDTCLASSLRKTAFLGTLVCSIMLGHIQITVNHLISITWPLGNGCLGSGVSLKTPIPLVTYLIFVSTSRYHI